MDKSKIEKFAINSRKKLIEDLIYEANRIGIKSDGTIENPITRADGMETYSITGSTQHTHTIYGKQIEQRKELIHEIDINGFEYTIEKIAYTWFNRIIAVRYMEVNDYLPTRTRVLSSEIPGKIEPDIITDALDLDLDYTSDDIDLIFQYKEENRTDELFKFLFIKQCNKLNEILPELFEKIDDYSEVLFNISLSDSDNIIHTLIETIPEEDFENQVEIIGWLYQYYNTELKDDTYKKLKKKNYKVSKDRLPSVTQLFTPDWIVKYMVENSLGRLWIENHQNNDLKNNWEYFVEEAEQEEDVISKLNIIKSTYKGISPEDITILDPSMGSGHILVYVFDVLMQIYLSCGYSKKEACVNILKNNIYGIDIDDRAYQLAYFAVMMKARTYNSKIFKMNIKPNLISIQESNSLSENFIQNLKKINPNLEKDIEYIYSTFKDAKILGSIININQQIDLNNFNDIKYMSKEALIDNYNISEKKLFDKIISQAIYLQNKYDVVIFELIINIS